jgi:hypothetical protein
MKFCQSKTIPTDATYTNWIYNLDQNMHGKYRRKRCLGQLY